jgi:hypothetical protein
MSMLRVLIKDPSTMTLEKFIKLFDKEGCIVLLEGKRDTSKYKDSFIVDKITPI